MKRLVAFLLVMVFVVTPFEVRAFNEERDLTVVFIGRFVSFVHWSSHQQKRFYITVIDDNPFDDALDNLYEDKMIHGKPISIKYVTKVKDIGDCDILFITITNTKAMQEAIAYAQNKSILTISDKRGFAQRGGIIQLSFVMQQVQLKINFSAAQKSQIKIDAPLLSIAEVIREDTL